MESNSSTQHHEHQANEILSLLNNAKPKQEVKADPNKPTTEVRQLFIGNLPFRVRWQDIKDLFRKAGHVIRADVALNHENRSKGHGTVLFTTAEDAQKAIDLFNNYKWQGRILEVRGDRGFVDNKHNDEPLSSPNENKKLVSPSSTIKSLSPAVEVKKEILIEKNSNVEKETKKEKDIEKVKVEMEAEEETNDDCKQLFVGNLPFHCQWQDLKDLFRHSGRISRADVVLNFEGRSRGFGTVLFSSHEDAKNAIEKYNGFGFHGRILRVHFDKFAATHAKLREHEANTYGQRQIHDPESIELLRQTYLPQHQLPTVNPMPYGFSSLIMPHQTPYHYYAQPQHQQMPFGNNLDMYQSNAMYTPLNNNNNFVGYQHSPSSYPTTLNNNTTTTTRIHNNPMFEYPPMQLQQQPYYQSPYIQPNNNNDLNSLSTSLRNLDIHNNTANPNSAGLDGEKDW